MDNLHPKLTLALFLFMGEYGLLITTEPERTECFRGWGGGLREQGMRQGPRRGTELSLMPGFSHS